MMARIRKSMNEKDQGFTLIELLVVMIIIGILAAIAIPVFLNQRKKAVDTAARSDVSILGKEIATYYVDATTVLDAISSGTGDDARYFIGDAAKGDIGKVSKGVTSPVISYEKRDSVINASQSWCVQVTITGGTHTNVSYSAKGGLKDAACSTAAAGGSGTPG